MAVETSEEAFGTSSIGSAWPPEEASAARMRGVYPAVITDERGVDAFADEYQAAVRTTQENPATTRLSVRAFVGEQLVRRLVERGIGIEAAVPLADTGGLWMVYATWNALGRRMSPGELAAHTKLVDSIWTSEIPQDQDPAVKLRKSGYEPKLIDATTDYGARMVKVDQFLPLYVTFGFSRDDVEEVLTNPSNTIAYLEEDGNIISTVLAERAVIRLTRDGEPANVAVTEITVAVTHPGVQGKGIYTALSGYLVSHLVNMRASGNREQYTSGIYGESNLFSPGAIVAAYRNGRRASRDDAKRLGIRDPSFGILWQNFEVNDGNKTRPYNNFLVTYVNLEDIQAINSSRSSG